MEELIINSIFHPTDFSAGDELAYAHSLKLAMAAGAELCLFHVRDPAETPYWGNFPHIRETLKRWDVDLSGGDDALAAEGVDSIKVVRSGPDPVGSTVEFIRKHCFDLVVLATHQRQGLDRWMHRAIAEKIGRRSGEMTLFVPRGKKGFVALENGELNLERILIPVCPDPRPQSAIDAATRIAELAGCRRLRLTALHVAVPGQDAPTVLLPEKPDWNCEHATCKGDVVEVILAEARSREADLIVMATAGHDGFLDMIRGSVTERVLRESPCPLLAIHAAGSTERD